MILQGFELRAGYILAFGEWELDLHNDYDLIDVRYQESGGTALVTLRRADGEWVDASQPKSIAMHFYQVSRFLSRAGNRARAEDRKTIAFIGFLYAEDETMDGYLDELTEPSQDLILGMEDESSVKIQAECVTLSVDA